MKRLTSIFLALAMLLTFIPVNVLAAEKEKVTFTDVEESDYFAQAAIALEQLDILSGYPDGTFGPEKAITRAEMAAVVCRMINKEADAEKSKGTTKYDDVSEDHWASGYINIASEEGIINGDGNGKFRPEDDVLYEEAIKMVVCALGYDEEVKIDPKDWSKGYLEVADKKGISDNLKGEKGESATRGDVALMSYTGIVADIAAPKISLKSGTYTGKQTVKITTDTANAEIYYTLDGSTPTINSNKYTDSVAVSKSSTLKAVVVKYGLFTSEEASAKYVISHTVPGSGTSRPSTTKYTVSFDLNYEGATGAPASQSVKKNECAKAPTTPEREGFVFVGWYTDNTYSELFNFTTPITKAHTLIARWVDMTDTTDTDEDGLTDPIEEYYGTDKTKPDTDEDGLTDFFEIKSSNTNPLVTDSNENGVTDAEEDFDEDGLNNLQEQTNNCNPYFDDTDMDGLTDYDEINTHNTKPDVEDTDEDGLADGDEIELGLDPLVQKTDGTTLDSERTFTQELSENNISEDLLSEDNAAVPSLTLTASGNINSDVLIFSTSSNDFSDSRAIVGEAIDVLGENISEGTISFTLQNEGGSLLSVDDTDEIFNTNLICKYNADGSTEYLDTDYDSNTNTLSADIYGEGTYFVMDVKNLFDELGLAMPTVADLSSLSDPEPIALMSIDEFTEEDNENQNNNSNESTEEISLMSIDEVSEDINVVAASAETEKVTLMASSGVMAQADIVFIIDTTGSMGDEINNVKNNINAFVDVLKSKGVSAGLALIDYQDLEADGYDSTRVHKNGTSNWFYNMDDYKTAISNLYLGYGGDTPECAVDALETARLLDMRASAGKIFVLVTDADYKVDNRYGIPSMAAEIELLKNEGVTCSVVCPSYEQSTYYNLYNDTNGIWADIYGNFNTELTALADRIGEEIVGDGYWIYLQGPVPVPVRLNAMPEEGSTVDTDEDGIPDIEELESATPTGEIDLDELITKVSRGVITGTDYGVVKMYKYKSSPNEKDTDFDGYYDENDSNPKKWDISDRDLAMCAQICYEDIPEGTLLSNLDSLYPEYANEIKNSFKGAASLDELKGWSVFKTHYSLGGLQIAVFKKDNSLVFACRGSEDKEDWYKLGTEGWKDWFVADGLGWVTGFNAQAPAAKSFVKKVMKAYPSYDVYVTGHSLGGNVAYNLASKALDVDRDNVKKINTYNGLGLLFGLTLGLTDIVDEYRLVMNDHIITDYHIIGDPVFPLSIFHYGEPKELPEVSGAYGAHDLYSFFVHLKLDSRGSDSGSGGGRF